MTRAHRRIAGGVVVLAVAAAFAFALATGSPTSSGLLSPDAGCPHTSSCAALLGYAGPTPTTPTIGATTTVYFLAKYGIGAPFDLVVTGSGVAESLFVRATPIMVLPPGGLVAYNPGHGGQRPNAAVHGDYPADCVFGAPDCLWRLTFRIPATGLSENGRYTATLTAYSDSGAGDRVIWQIPFTGADTPFDPAIGTALAALVLGLVLLIRINRRRPTAA